MGTATSNQDGIARFRSLSPGSYKASLMSISPQEEGNFTETNWMEQLLTIGSSTADSTKEYTWQVTHSRDGSLTITTRDLAAKGKLPVSGGTYTLISSVSGLDDRSEQTAGSNGKVTFSNLLRGITYTPKWDYSGVLDPTLTGSALTVSGAAVTTADSQFTPKASDLKGLRDFYLTHKKGIFKVKMWDFNDQTKLLSGASIVLTHLDGTEFHVVTGRDGMAVFNGIPYGLSYRIQVKNNPFEGTAGVSYVPSPETLSTILAFDPSMDMDASPVAVHADKRKLPG